MTRADILPAHLVVNERRIIVRSTEGVDVVVTDWGQEDDVRPVLFMAHATGMHGHAWLPTVIALGNRFRCIAIDQRAQGDSNPPTTGDLSWSGVADDVEVVLSVLGLLGRSDVYGIGHSQGGYAVLETERRRPGTFTALFLWEPVVFPLVLARDALAENSMVTIARKRRRSFESWQAAVDNFRGKGPFAKVDEDLLRCYVYWGFDEEPDGSITLKCSPENESDLFRLSITDLFEHVDGIGCPTTLALGSFTNEGFATMNPIVAERMPNGRLLRFEGRTHFGIFEGIEEIADTVASTLLGSAKT